MGTPSTHICIYTVITENNLKIAILINVYTHKKKKARIIFVVAYRIQTYIFQSSNHCQRCRGQQQKQRRRRRRQQQKLPGGRGRAGKRRRLLRDSFLLHLNDSMTIEKKKKVFQTILLYFCHSGSPSFSKER